MRETRLEMNGNGRVSQAGLMKQIEAHFDGEELDDLIFTLDIGKGVIGGRTHRARLRRLVEHAARHSLVEKLVGVCKELRPGVEW